MDTRLCIQIGGPEQSCDALESEGHLRVGRGAAAVAIVCGQERHPKVGTVTLTHGAVCCAVPNHPRGKPVGPTASPYRMITALPPDRPRAGDQRRSAPLQHCKI